MSDQTRPFQFGLKDLFALTALVAVLLGMLPVAYRSPSVAIGVYLACGLLQEACLLLTYQRFRRTGIDANHPNHEIYEAAMLASVLTMWTWMLTIMWLLGIWLGFVLLYSPAVGLVFLGIILHVPVFFPNLIGLMTLRDRGAHRALNALCVLNLSNTLLVFAVMIALLSPRLAL